MDSLLENVTNQIRDLKNLIDRDRKEISDLKDLIYTRFEKEHRMIKDGYAARESAESPTSQESKASNEPKKARFLIPIPGFLLNISATGHHDDQRKKLLNKFSTAVSRGTPEEHCPELIGHDITDTGVYSTEATPAALNKLVNTVRNRVEAYATKLFQVAESREPSMHFLIGEIEAVAQQLEIWADEKYPLIKKSLTQAVICKYVFLDFERAHFSSNPQQAFEKPDELKRKRIVIYKKNIDEEPGTMLKTLRDFEKFVSTKGSHFKELLGKFLKENTVPNDIIQRFDDFNSDHGLLS